MTEFEAQVKVVILGNPSVGKSSILRRFIIGDFSPDSPNTIGAKFMGKVLSVNNRAIKLNIWDTAGQERYQSFSKLYCRDAAAAILVYDITDPESFEGMKKWYDIMSKDILPSEALLFIAGNKSDLLKGECSFVNEVIGYYDGIRAEHFRVSAVSGEGVDSMFQRVAEKYTENVKWRRNDSIYLTNKLPVKEQKKKRSFC
jgi:small GTP-binding protein